MNDVSKILTIYIFILSIFYILLGIGASLTEHIFIKYIKSSWKYKKPNVFTIPILLILLWSLAIVLIT